MQRLILYLIVFGLFIMGAVVLLPLMGLLLLLVLAVIGLYLAAPFLARLPWFRDWIHVDEIGGRRIVRFGRAFTGYREPPRRAHWEGSGLQAGDYIDAETRILDDEDPEEAARPTERSDPKQ